MLQNRKVQSSHHYLIVACYQILTFYQISIEIIFLNSCLRSLVITVVYQDLGTCHQYQFKSCIFKNYFVLQCVLLVEHQRIITQHTKHSIVKSKISQQIPAQRRRRQMLTACNVTPPATTLRLLHKEWLKGSGNRSNLWLLDPLTNFCLISFLIDHSFYQNPKNPKWLPGGPTMADGIRREEHSQVLDTPVNFREPSF